jgi:DNA-binding HxlR family transcriptional regulator
MGHMTTSPEAVAAPEHEPRACDAALSRAFEFLGKRWNGVLLATLLNGPATFSELRRSVRGISDSMLSDRLGELCRAGLVSRTVDEGPPVAVDYALTPSGTALLPALHELTTWAADNLPACPGSRPATVGKAVGRRRGTRA